MTTSSKRDALVADVRKWEETQARWEAESAACEAEMDGIRDRMGEAVLADENQAKVLTTKLRDLADSADAAKRAAVAAVPKLAAARSAVLEHDACRFDEEAERHAKVLNEHRTKTARLLAQLERHEGRFVYERTVTGLGDGGAEIIGQLPKSYELELRVKRAQLRAAVLRDVAAGRDPLGQGGRLSEMAAQDLRSGLIFGLPKSEYLSPAISGREAVVPDRRYEDEVQSVRRQLEVHDEEAAVDVGPQIADLETRIEKLQAEINGRMTTARGKPTVDESERLEGMRYLIMELETKRDTADERRAAIVARLEALTGERESATA